MEDVEGRLVVHATAQVMIGQSRFMSRERREPAKLEPILEPSYPTPDPHARPLDVADGVPLARLLGTEFVEVKPGAVTLSLRPNDWMHSGLRVVSPVVLHVLLSCAMRMATGTLSAKAGRFGLIEHSSHFAFTVGGMAPVPPRGLYVARAKVAVRSDDSVYATGELEAEDDTTLIMSNLSSTMVSMLDSTPEISRDRVLAAVLYTDIVGSTPYAERLGDARWKDLLEEFHDRSSKQVTTFRGREVKWTGDGILATFDSPARAVQCARAIRDAAQRQQIEIRAGIHVGECELMGADVAGIAVHVAQRVLDAAEPGSIYVTSTVREASAGSGLRFTDKGRHALKGIDGDWQLCAVDD